MLPTKRIASTECVLANDVADYIGVNRQAVRRKAGDAAIKTGVDYWIPVNKLRDIAYSYANLDEERGPKAEDLAWWAAVENDPQEPAATEVKHDTTSFDAGSIVLNNPTVLFAIMLFVIYAQSNAFAYLWHKVAPLGAEMNHFLLVGVGMIASSSSILMALSSDGSSHWIRMSYLWAFFILEFSVDLCLMGVFGENTILIGRVLCGAWAPLGILTVSHNYILKNGRSN